MAIETVEGAVSAAQDLPLRRQAKRSQGERPSMSLGPMEGHLSRRLRQFKA
jgi:hypothetical protein